MTTNIRLLLGGTLLFLLSGNSLSAQEGMPVQISVFTESTSLPFSTLTTDPIHPGIQIGTHFEGNTDRSLRLYPTLTVGYLFHRKLFQGLYADAGIAVDWRLKVGLNLKADLSLGYLRTYAAQQEFRLVNGELLPRKDRGNHRIKPSLSLGMGWRLRPRELRSTEVFALYQTWLEYPYSPGFIPLMSHTNLHLGTKFYPFK
ncbi:MAG: hypothetical protein WBA17_01350 [Saprospiraceae bacterium]